MGNFHLSIDSYKIFSHTHCFGYPELIFPLKNKLPYYTISFPWNKRLLDPNLLCDESSVNPYNFFCEGSNTLPQMKTLFPLIKFIGIGAQPAQKLCIVVHHKKLVKLSSPSRQFTFNKKKTKSFKKVKLVYLRMSIR